MKHINKPFLLLRVGFSDTLYKHIESTAEKKSNTMQKMWNCVTGKGSIINICKRYCCFDSIESIDMQANNENEWQTVTTKSYINRLQIKEAEGRRYMYRGKTLVYLLNVFFLCLWTCPPRSFRKTRSILLWTYDNIGNVLKMLPKSTRVMSMEFNEGNAKRN